MAKKYFEGIGRRKTSTCRVRIYTGKGKTTVNGQEYDKYFADFIDRDKMLNEVLEKVGKQGKFDITVIAKGGGKRSQIEAVRLGLARVLVKYDQDNKTTLKDEGYLTRDPRMKERKKPGRKRARRSAQWVKR